MILANFEIQKPLVFEEGRINVLVLENPLYFRETMLKLLSQKRGDDEEWILSEDNHTLNFVKDVEVVNDVLSLEDNPRSLITKMLKDAVDVGNGMHEAVIKLLSSVNEFANNLVMELDYNATFNEIQAIDGIVKMLDIKVDYEGMDYVDKIVEYMRVYRKFLGTKLFIFFGLRSILCEDERNALYQMVIYEKYDVLLLEGYITEPFSPIEKIRIIDKDFCEL